MFLSLLSKVGVLPFFHLPVLSLKEKEKGERYETSGVAEVKREKKIWLRGQLITESLLLNISSGLKSLIPRHNFQCSKKEADGTGPN
jgi:hypothetical protein